MKHKFLDDIEQGIYDSMLESIGTGESYASYQYHCDCGDIDVYVNKKNDVEVIVYSDSDREYPNIINAVENIIPNWYDVEKDYVPYDYWNENGFRDARDFETYKFGHGGLR